MRIPVPIFALKDILTFACVYQYLWFFCHKKGSTTPIISVEAFASSTGGTFDATLEAISTSEYWLASVVSGDFTGGSITQGRQTSLGTLDGIGKSSTLAGTYTSLFGTVSGNNVVESANTGSSLGYFVLARKSGCVAPTTQASNISFTNVDLYTMTVNWTNGNGSKRVLVMNTSSSFNSIANGTDPLANNNYSGGEQVVYKGTASTTNIRWNFLSLLYLNGPDKIGSLCK